MHAQKTLYDLAAYFKLKSLVYKLHLNWCQTDCLRPSRSTLKTCCASVWWLGLVVTLLPMFETYFKSCVYNKLETPFPKKLAAWMHIKMVIKWNSNGHNRFMLHWLCQVISSLLQEPKNMNQQITFLLGEQMCMCVRVHMCVCVCVQLKKILFFLFWYTSIRNHSLLCFSFSSAC